MHSSITAAALVALVPLAAAHGFVNNVNAGGKDYPQIGPNHAYNAANKEAGWRAGNQDNGFVASDASTLAGPQIACHKGYNRAAAQPGLGEAIPVAAGSAVTLTWNTWPVSHHGPVINYLAKCPGKCNALTDATSLRFFKINAEGLITPGNENGWASDKLMANGMKGVANIPSNLAAGEYVLRHEILALHSAGNAGGAQFYPQCVSINVSGGGSSAPSGTLGSALYKSTDPGVTINIYQKLTSYTIPGPSAVTRRVKQFFA
ncbi:hypothetical protein KVT40_006477 [Elsinoe batatas]|uniref:Auxiliary Activity family 9 catalytic domain-containing protein n=1 Tax=Elsinoe batatas TaxID=2601811 RepID=A0A8K0L1S0_9PEZI|nr:hypothetical protein KVT40_006477 [Elsinoe batatas]